MALSAQKRLIVQLVLAVVAMFAFGFAMVPLYDVFCEITGINGKTRNQAYQQPLQAIDRSRTVKVQFIARKNDQMNWEFKPEDKTLSVHPGESVKTTFYAKNPNTRAMVAQAIPSVSPGRAAAWFHKTACFCFERQPLPANANTDMPLVFVVDKDLPNDIHTITLAYTLFDVTDTVAARPSYQEPVNSE